MKRMEIGKAILLGVITLMGLVLLGWWGLNFSWNRGWLSSEDVELRSCGTDKQLFSEWPIGDNQLVAITPLGSMNPTGGSVFPSDRILWRTKNGDGGADFSEVSVYAPGEVWVTKVKEFEYWSGEKMIDKDYAVFFSPCQEVNGGFYHLKSLSPKFEQVGELKYKSERSYSTGGLTVVRREAKTKLWWQRGEMIGSAGGLSHRQIFAWGLIDKRTTPLLFAHTTEADSMLEHAVCPLDYYSAVKRKELEGYLGDGKRKRVEAPICGRLDQDVAGTLQGVWRAEKTVGILGEDQHVALVHDEIEPTRPVFSMGTSLEKSGLKAGLYYFDVKETGLINRDFGSATETGRVYCYQGLNNSQGEVIRRIILAEIVDEKSMKMEARPGFSCAATGYMFSDRMTVFER